MRPFAFEEGPSRVPHTWNPLARETVKGTEFPPFPPIYIPCYYHNISTVLSFLFYKLTDYLPSIVFLDQGKRDAPFEGQRKNCRWSAIDHDKGFTPQYKPNLLAKAYN